MNAPENIFLPDVQASLDERNIVIQKVGIKSVRHPVLLQTQTGSQPSVAMIDMTVMLPSNVKGTHMSRFLEVLQNHHEPLNLVSIKTMMVNMLNRLEAEEGHLDLRMPLFLKKAAPVSGVESLLDYDLHIKAAFKNGTLKYTLQVQVPVTSLCPCSKKISEYGAHNQRSHVTVTAVLNSHIWLEEIIQKVEAQASCELYGLLKRPDEKYVTERAYDNPKFVEDMVRDVAVKLNEEARIDAYVVESENFESIHNHSAYALIENDKRKR